MTATLLTARRCSHHAAREAVARCPQCGDFFCRECITEHDDQVICSACLRKISVAPKTQRWKLSVLFRPVAVIAGIFMAWVFFYGIGRVLVAIPSSFHEGTIWEVAEALDSSSK